MVSKGFELLGDEKVARRLGGIYALEGVMTSSEQYHQAALEALCAFVRDGAKARLDKERESPAIDIQAALTVVGRRTDGPGFVDSIGAYVPKAILNDANLTRADLTQADLTRADLTHANPKTTPT
jgi:hypothetical protein